MKRANSLLKQWLYGIIFIKGRCVFYDAVIYCTERQFAAREGRHAAEYSIDTPGCYS